MITLLTYLAIGCLAFLVGVVMPRVGAAMLFGFFAFGSYECVDDGSTVTAGLLLAEGIALAWMIVAMSRDVRRYEATDGKTFAEVTTPRGQTQEQR